MTLEPIYQIMGQILPFAWLEPTFMKRALLATVIISPICASMGVQMINFRMAFFSDAISHSAFTGIALGVLFNYNPYVTMILFGLLVSVGITKVKRGSELSIDTIIGIFFSAAVALGIAIISARKGLTRNLQAFLYGDVLAVSDSEILWFVGFFVLVIAFLAYGYNKLILMGISERLAKADGVTVYVYDYAFALMLALTIAFSIRAIGILLVTAMLIVPAAAGRNMARNAGSSFWYSTGIALFSSVAGLISSYYIDTATGATIILFAVGCFILTQIIKMLRDRIILSA